MSGVIGNIIAQALTGARPNAMAKIAAEGDVSQCEVCGKAVSSDSKMCQECADKKAKSEARQSGHSMEGDENKPPDDSQQEKTSAMVDPDRVEKLASALDFITMNPHLVDWTEVYKLAADFGAGATPIKVAPGSGTQPATDEGTGVEKTPADLGSSVAHSIPTDPMVNATQLRTDNREGEGPKTEPKAGVSGSKAGGVQTGAVARIKQAMAKSAATADVPVPEQPLQVSSGPVPAGLERPAEVTKQEQLVSSNEAVGAATVRQAREVPKRQTGEHLNEPMLSRKGDKTLDQMFGAQRVDEAGAKVASARAQELVAKIASTNCTCAGDDSCGACRIRKVAEQRHAATVGSMQDGTRNPVMGRA